MSQVEFTADEKAILVDAIKSHFEAELNSEIDRFDAEALIRFFSTELGSYDYHRGLYDAQHILDERMDSVRASILELEEPTEFLR